MADKDPAWAPGTRVHLKTDQNRKPHTWTVITTVPGGAIRIQKEGHPPSMYTQMHTNPNNLKPAKEAQQ